MALDIINKFCKQKILVIGDLMLDQYLKGDVTRISPEAPTPVFNVNEYVNVLGGAANVAANICSLGAKVSICGVTGDDEARKILLKELILKKILVKGVITDKKRRTTIKQRALCGSHQLIRLDFESFENISGKVEDKIIKVLSKAIKTFDAIVISDYAKGMITPKIINFLKQNSENIFVDCKLKNVELYKDVFLIKPNLKEAIEMSGISDNVEKIGKNLVEKFNANIFITKGKEGISIFTKDGKIEHVETKPRFVFDVTGAGDSTMAGIVLSICAGAKFKEAAQIANVLGGIVVQKIGTSTVSLDELKNNINLDNVTN